jgi:hypothetical protein
VDRPQEAGLPDDADLAAVAPSTIVRVASGLVMVAGLAAALVGVQNLVGYRMSGLYFGMLVGLVVAGVAAIVIGWIHGKARTWAAVASLVLSAILLVGSLAWVLVSFMGGGLSVMAFLAVGLAGLSVVVVPFSLAPCRRATAAREKLRDAGLDLGL